MSIPALKEHKEILKALLDLAAGKELYLVGGAVRDMLLDREILDLDFAIKDSGRDFATIAARKLNGAFVPLSDRDDEARVVVRKELILDFKGFSRSIGDDLADRDFTFNAMAVDVKMLLEGKAKGMLIDPFEGKKDLKRGVIRKVGPDSIRNDPLRMLRAYRFAAQLGFETDSALESEIEKTSLAGIAGERISYEMVAIMSCPRVYPLVSRMISAGLLQQIFPFRKFWTDYQVRAHSLAVLDRLEKVLFYKNFSLKIREMINDINADPNRVALLKLAALFHDVSKPETRIRTTDGTLHFYGHDTRGAKKMRETLLGRLRFSRQDAERVEQIVARHMHMHLIATAPQLTERAMRRFMRQCSDCATDIMVLDLADGFATAGRTRHLEVAISRILNLAREDAKRAAFVPLVNGHDLIKMGLEPGPIFKKILGELEELQWERKLTSKQQALEMVRNKLAQGEY